MTGRVQEKTLWASVLQLADIALGLPAGNSPVRGGGDDLPQGLLQRIPGGEYARDLDRKSVV